MSNKEVRELIEEPCVKGGAANDWRAVTGSAWRRTALESSGSQERQVTTAGRETPSPK